LGGVGGGGVGCRLWGSRPPPPPPHPQPPNPQSPIPIILFINIFFSYKI